MKLHDITWPIYPIRYFDRLYTEYNVTYVEKDGVTKILDNKNLNGDSLGKRRLKIPKEDRYRLLKPIYLFSEILEWCRRNLIQERFFIDSKGKVFKYNYTMYVPLIWRKLKSYEVLEDSILIYVDSILSPLEISRHYYNKLLNSNLYVGLLKIKNFYLLYDFSEEYKIDSKRKI